MTTEPTELVCVNGHDRCNEGPFDGCPYCERRAPTPSSSPMMELTIKSNNNSNLTEKIASEEITLILNEWDTFTFGSYADKNEAIRAQTDLTTRMAAALTAQAAEVERLTGLMQERGESFYRTLAKIEAERDIARAALRDLLAGYDRWSTMIPLPPDMQPRIVHAREALTALPSPTLPPTKGEGK